MRRSAPLKRSTPLKSGKATLRRTPLARIGTRAKRAAPGRRRCIEAVKLRSGGRCEARFSPDCSGRHDDAHELLPRSGGGAIDDPANVISVCRRCHDAIHDNPAEAMRLGLLKSRYP